MSEQKKAQKLEIRLLAVFGGDPKDDLKCRVDLDIAPDDPDFEKQWAELGAHFKSAYIRGLQTLEPATANQS